MHALGVGGANLVFLALKLAAVCVFYFALWKLYRVALRSQGASRAVFLLLTGALAVLPIVPAFPGRLVASAYCDRMQTASKTNDVKAASFAFPAKLPTTYYHYPAPTVEDLHDLLAVKKFVVVELPAWKSDPRDVPGIAEGWPHMRFNDGHRRRYYLSERSDPNCAAFNTEISAYAALHAKLIAQATKSGLLPDLCIAAIDAGDSVADLQIYEILKDRAGQPVPLGFTIYRELGFVRTGTTAPAQWKRAAGYHESFYLISFLSPFTFLETSPIECGSISLDFYGAGSEIGRMAQDVKSSPDADLLRQVGTHGSEKVRAFYGLP